MKFNQFRSRYEKELRKALQGVDSGQVERARELIEQCQGTIWLIGNGGLASLAEHMAVDLQLAGKRAQALTNSAAVTTWGNDHHFMFCFEDQIKKLARDGDLVIGMSGSGGSHNILGALEWRGPWKSLAIIGGKAEVGDYQIHLPTTHIGIAQDLTQIILHEITYSMMEGKK